MIPPQDKPIEITAGDNNINTQFSSWRIFSIPYTFLTWILGFRWYVILFMVVVTLYIIFQLQYAFENRRKKYNAEKEQMSTKKETDGITYDRDKKTKHVSFSDEDKNIYIEPEAFTNNNSAANESLFVTLKRTIEQIYKSWILPWIYMLFKTAGIGR
jgi:hypothetical protein